MASSSALGDYRLLHLFRGDIITARQGQVPLLARAHAQKALRQGSLHRGQAGRRSIQAGYGQLRQGAEQSGRRQVDFRWTESIPVSGQVTIGQIVEDI